MHDHELGDCGCTDNDTPITDAVVRKFPTLGIARALKKAVETRLRPQPPADNPEPPADTNPLP